MERVLTDMKFPTTWMPETVEKVDGYFRSKYPVGPKGEGLNEKKLWRDQRLLDLAKHKQSYVDRDYRIFRYPLTVPEDQGQSLLGAIEKTLKQVYKQVKVRLVPGSEASTMDLSGEPWNLAGANLGSDGIFCQLGNLRFVELNETIAV